MFPLKNELQPGFTLFEVIVALAIAAIVITSAHLMIRQLAAAEEHIRHLANEADATANSAWQLRMLLLNREHLSDSSAGFYGDQHLMRFSSWCDNPRGWVERCEVVLTLPSDSEMHAVIGILPGGDTLRLGGTVGARFQYLENEGEDSYWASDWPPGILAPQAVRIVFADTVWILRVGGRWR